MGAVDGLLNYALNSESFSQSRSHNPLSSSFPPLIHSLLSLISIKLSQDLVHPQRCTRFRNVVFF